MTYRLSIPTPLEGGIESHHHCGSILLQRLDSNFTIIIGPTLTMRMTTGMSCTVSYSCFAYLSESWSDGHGCMDDENLGGRVL